MSVKSAPRLFCIKNEREPVIFHGKLTRVDYSVLKIYFNRLLSIKKEREPVILHHDSRLLLM